MIDALSHSRSFKTGFPVFGVNGYWRMVDNSDPWTVAEPTTTAQWCWRGLSPLYPRIATPALSPQPVGTTPQVFSYTPCYYTQAYTSYPADDSPMETFISMN